jgi:hypothetical protein
MMHDLFILGMYYIREDIFHYIGSTCLRVCGIHFLVEMKMHKTITQDFITHMQRIDTVWVIKCMCQVRNELLLYASPTMTL